MNTGGSPPRRVRVTGPQAPSARPRPAQRPREIDADTRLGGIYLSSLLRSQLRLATIALATVGVLLAGLPVAFWLLPPLAHAEVLGVPLALVLLGVAVYPFLLLVGWRYVRAAERVERDFTDVVDRS